MFKFQTVCISVKLRHLAKISYLFWPLHLKSRHFKTYALNYSKVAKVVLYPYLLWPFGNKLISYLVTCINTNAFTVRIIWEGHKVWKRKYNLIWNYLVKFIYSEISTIDLTTLDKSTMEISQKFVVF